MRRQYGAIAAALAPQVDVLLAETLSSVAEARCALEAAAAHGQWPGAALLRCCGLAALFLQPLRKSMHESS
jgi:hypothetical protein